MIEGRMQAERKARKWSMRELAERSGISEGYLWLLERGHRPNPTVDTLEKLAAAFGISVDTLLHGAAAAEDLSQPPEELLRAAGYPEDTIQLLCETWTGLASERRLAIVAGAHEDVEAKQRRENRLRDLLRQAARVC